jgi:dTDP-4-dehydrorhamnose 3,5-epimerase
MNVVETAIPSVKVIEPKVFGDHRGFFLETYHRKRYREAGIGTDFVQDNHSRSKKGILRGLHYQLRHPQGKLVWCIVGSIFDVAVDLRPGSTSFGKWVGVNLSSENKKQVWVPPGFAHGFCVTSEHAEVIYKCTDLYDAADEGGIVWNDPTVAIDWPITDPILSDKDAKLPLLEQAKLPKAIVRE